MDRSVRYRTNEEFVDNEFLSFLAKNSPFDTVPLYTLTKPTIQIGYQEASKFNTRCDVLIPEDVYDGALQLWSHLIAPYMQYRYMLYKEVLVGSPKDTATGHPLGCIFKTKGEAYKDWNFEEAYMEYFSLMADSRTYVPSVCTSSVKLEMKKIEKVVGEETARTFMPVPHFTHLLGMQYYQHYMENVAKHYRDIPFCIGYTDKYRGADQLVRYMKFEDIAEPNETITFIESDVSGWDRSIQMPLRKMSWDALKLSFPEEYNQEPHKSRLKNMFFDSVCSPIMLERGDMFFAYGMKSGWFSTLDENSRINVLLCFVICYIMYREWWKKLHQSQQLKYVPYLHWDVFILYVRFKTMGDDFWGAMRSKYCVWFSKDIWIETTEKMCQLKLKYIKVTTDLSEIEFLGRTFKMSQWGCYLAYPNRNKMIDSFALHRTDDVSARLGRLLSLRTESFPDQPLFRFLTKWIELYFVRYEVPLRRRVGEYQTPNGGTDFVYTYEKLRAMFLPDAAVRILHLGFQKGDESYQQQIAEYESIENVKFLYELRGG